MKNFFTLALICFAVIALPAQNFMKLSQNILTAQRDGKDASAFVEQLATTSPDDLKAEINTQEEKLAFWINVYNGLIQYYLSKNPELFDDRGDFFSDDLLTIAGEKVSFDNLEHGVLRRNTSKFSGGYFSNPFADDWYEQYQVEKIDWRIHFALNCGASSCPPIRVYDSKSVYDQLNASSRMYLNSQVKYKKEEEEVYVPALMSWFRGDFGGLDGVRNILVKNDYIPNNEDIDIEFNEYDWTLKLGTFYKD